MEIIKNVSRWGNSAGVLLPKEWVNQEVKIILIDRTLQIKKEVLNILERYLHDILGIYLVGSYARQEQNKNSDIDILAISNKIKQEIISGKYHISIIPLVDIKKNLVQSPLTVYPRLMEARTIINPNLLKELIPIKISKNSFREFFEETKRVIKINKEFIKLDKLEGDSLLSTDILYSLVLRLRGMFIINSLLKNEKISNKKFKRWILNTISARDYDKVYGVYLSVKNNKKIKADIKLFVVERILDLLKKEIKKFGGK